MSCLERPIEAELPPRDFDERLWALDHIRKLYVITTVEEVTGVLPTPAEYYEMEGLELNPINHDDTVRAERSYCAELASFACFISSGLSVRNPDRAVQRVIRDEHAYREASLRNVSGNLGVVVAGRAPRQGKVHVPVSSNLDTMRTSLEVKMKPILYDERQALIGRLSIAG